MHVKQPHVPGRSNVTGLARALTIATGFAVWRALFEHHKKFPDARCVQLVHTTELDNVVLSAQNDDASVNLGSMWSTEVHECRLEQALQDNVAAHRAKKYGTQPPRADAASMDAISLVVVIAGVGCVIANHARLRGTSWISRLWKRARRQGDSEPTGRDEMRAATYRAAQRRKTESAQVSGGSSFSFPAPTASSSQRSTTIDRSFADEAAAAVSRKPNNQKPKSAKKKKKGKR